MADRPVDTPPGRRHNRPPKAHKSNVNVYQNIGYTGDGNGGAIREELYVNEFPSPKQPAKAKKRPHQPPPAPLSENLYGNDPKAAGSHGNHEATGGVYGNAPPPHSPTRSEQFQTSTNSQGYVRMRGNTPGVQHYDGPSTGSDQAVPLVTDDVKIELEQNPAYMRQTVRFDSHNEHHRESSTDPDVSPQEKVLASDHPVIHGTMSLMDLPSAAGKDTDPALPRPPVGHKNNKETCPKCTRKVLVIVLTVTLVVTFLVAFGLGWFAGSRHAAAEEIKTTILPTTAPPLTTEQTTTTTTVPETTTTYHTTTIPVDDTTEPTTYNVTAIDYNMTTPTYDYNVTSNYTTIF